MVEKLKLKPDAQNIGWASIFTCFTMNLCEMVRLAPDVMLYELNEPK